MSRTDDALQACESGRSANADDPVETHAEEVEHHVDVVPDQLHGAPHSLLDRDDRQKDDEGHDSEHGNLLHCFLPSFLCEWSPT